MTNDGLIWCTNDEPHEPHRRDNRWRDHDYCSGRPVPSVTRPKGFWATHVEDPQTGVITHEDGHVVYSPTGRREPEVPVRAVAAILDQYDNGEGECEPEDRWRLFRDMRALLTSDQVTPR